MQSEETDVEEFIKRRFAIDCNWTNGNCYWFALILKNRFDGEIYYEPVEGHFVCKIDNKYYDFNGVYLGGGGGLLKFDDIVTFDENLYRYLIRDCVL